MPGAVTFANGWPVLNLGRLSTRVQIQRTDLSRSPLGQKQATWMTMWTVWAAVESTGDTERMNSLQVTSDVTHSITMRYRKDLAIVPGMQALVMSNDVSIRTMRIKQVDNLNERNVALLLRCQELYGVS